jgi:hypothetical protein
MGLASSQARMLLLTARKSDLEYRAQAISQRQMNIALQTEQLATEYSTATSNRQMKLVTWVSTTNSEQQSVKEDLSFSGLLGVGTTISGNYLVTDGSGKYVISDYKDLGTIATKLGILTEADSGYTLKTGKNEEGQDETVSLSAESLTVGTVSSALANYGIQFTLISSISNNKYFQDGLRNGSFYLKQQVSSSDSSSTAIDAQFESVSWSSLSVIADGYDTSDDAEAEAEYEAQTLVLNNQDKMLDLELNQIETQHTAIESEIESVQKILDKNVETSFKIFS